MRDLSRDIEGVFRCLDTQTPREKRPNMSTVSSFEGNVRKPKGEVLYTGEFVKYGTEKAHKS